MANTYYPQSVCSQPKTLTVGELIALLQKLDPAQPAIFQSPPHGCFGPDMMYSIDAAQPAHYDAREEYHPAGFSEDEETGEREPYEEWTDKFLAWDGVVLK